MKNPNRTSLLEKFKIVAQPTETTCGPTCLHAVYRFLGDDVTLNELIGSINENPDGGTYSVMLANLALERGYEATIYSYNLRVFDPTWNGLDRETLIKKLSDRLEHITSKRGRTNLAAYITFLQLGGSIRFDELTSKLLKKILKDGSPIIAGLNSTHLYRNARVKKTGKDDDVHGEVEGHFVTLFGYDKKKKEILVADPYQKNPLSASLVYAIDAQRLINSIMLGIVTYDANLLVIKQKGQL